MGATAEELRAFAVAVAREAGQLTLRYFRGEFDVESKSDDTPVTRADREAELLVRRRIRETWPDDDILGEEFGVDAGSGERTWVIDPIDGTKSFVAGAPLYGVLVAAVDGRYKGGELDTARVVAGVIHLPPLAETVSAARGGGALWDAGDGRERVASVSGHDTLDGARVTTSDFADFHRREPKLAARVDEASALARTWGDAYGYLLVATGRLDAMIDPIVSPWDIAPLPVIIEEAGGRFTDLEGRPLLAPSAMGTNGRIHDALLSER